MSTPDNTATSQKLPSAASDDQETGFRERVAEVLSPSLTKLPEPERTHVIEEVTMMVRMSGPLPPPEIARQFEQMCPGFVDRSLGMAEKEQNAAIEGDRVERRMNQNYRILGMVCALLVTLAIIGAGLYIAVFVNVWAGAGTSLLGFGASAIVAFINGRPLDGTEAPEPQPARTSKAPAKGQKRKRNK